MTRAATKSGLISRAKPDSIFVEMAVQRKSCLFAV